MGVWFVFNDPLTVREVALVVFTVTTAVAFVPSEVFYYSVGGITRHGCCVDDSWVHPGPLINSAASRPRPHPPYVTRDAFTSSRNLSEQSNKLGDLF